MADGLQTVAYKKILPDECYKLNSEEVKTISLLRSFDQALGD